MLEKIKKINPWIFVVLLTIILFLATASIDLTYSSDDWLLKILASLFVPATELANTASKAAIELFSGRGFLSEMVNSSILFAMAGILVLLFIVPWMLVTGSKNDPETGDPVKSKRWIVAMPVIITATIIALGIGIVTTSYYIINKERIADGHKEDMMRQQLMDLTLNAASLVFLPHEAGGGDGLFTNFEGEESGEVRDIRLDDLDRFDDESPFHFEINAVVDSAMSITVQRPRGNLQLTGDVTPYEDPVFKVD